MYDNSEDMAPTVLRMGGFRFFFFSNEGHEEPHIHVESGANYAKFWLSPVVLAHSAGFNANEMHGLREMVQANNLMFQKRWEEHFGH